MRGGDGAIVLERNWTWFEGNGGVVKDGEVLESESTVGAVEAGPNGSIFAF